MQRLVHIFVPSPSLDSKSDQWRGTFMYCSQTLNSVHKKSNGVHILITRIGLDLHTC
jgi:hypothetical protein